ncbi:hypothetical protein D3C75_936250 [compost metagenome]
MLLHTFIRQGIVQHRHIHHRLFSPVAFIQIRQRFALTVGPEQGSRPALGRIPHGFPQVIDACPQHSPDDIIMLLHVHPGNVLTEVLHLIGMPSEILVGFRPENQLAGNSLMDRGIPLLLVVAADHIHNIGNPLDALDPVLQIINFRVADLIHKLLNVLHLGQVHIALIFKVGIHGIRHRPGIVQG